MTQTSLSSNGHAHAATTKKHGIDSSDAEHAKSAARQQFVGAALNMSWQLAVVVLVPIFAGVQLDKHFDMVPVWTIAGFVVAVAGFAGVVWKAYVTFNQPVTQADIEHAKRLREQEEDDE